MKKKLRLRRKSMSDINEAEFQKDDRKIDRVYIDKEDKEKYDRLQEISFFQGRTNSQLFLFAICYALKNGGGKHPLKNKLGYFRLESTKDEEILLIKTLAMYDSDNVEVLTDDKQIYSIAEEYANFGIKILSDTYESTQYGSFHKTIEKDIHDLLSKIERAERY